MNLIEVYNSVMDATKSNPVIAGVASLYGLGIATYLLKDTPKKIATFFQKHLTTTLSIANSHMSFHHLMRLLEKEKVVDHLRSIKFLNGRFGESDVIKGIGLGKHIFFYKHRPLFIEVDEKTSTDINEKLTLSIRKFGRSHKLFDQLKEEISKCNNSRDETKTDTLIVLFFKKKRKNL